MTLEEMNFRELAYQYVLFYDISESDMRVYKKIYPNELGDNAILTYGYIDNQAGLSFEVLGCARRFDDGTVAVREPSPMTSFKLRYGAIKAQVQRLDYRIEFDKYTIIETIKNNYGAGTDLEKIRMDTRFDEFRYPSCPDDIAVFLIKPNVKPERVWVRTSHIENGKIAGKLINQPNSREFGVNMGDTVCIVCVRMNDGTDVVVADFPWLHN